MAAVVRGPRVLGMNVGERRLFSLQTHPGEIPAAPKGPLKSPHGLDCFRERLSVRHCHPQNDHREGLMQKPGPKRNRENERHNADRGLQGGATAKARRWARLPAATRDV